MGITTVRVRVANLQYPSRFFEDDFIVDTGAVLSFAPADRLAAIGITPSRQERFRLVDGSIVPRSVGDAFFEVEGKRAPASVVFGEPGDAMLLGAVTREMLAFAVDPVSRRLQSVTMLAISARPV